MDKEHPSFCTSQSPERNSNVARQPPCRGSSTAASVCVCGQRMHRGAAPLVSGACHCCTDWLPRKPMPKDIFLAPTKLMMAVVDARHRAQCNVLQCHSDGQTYDNVRLELRDAKPPKDEGGICVGGSWGCLQRIVGLWQVHQKTKTKKFFVCSLCVAKPPCQQKKEQ